MSEVHGVVCAGQNATKVAEALQALDVELNERANEAVVYVADNGPGVPPEMREGLFQKGKKGFDSPGTGFGLYLVRETVDAYGGSVDVVDDDHDGATFAVTLPLAETTIA